MYIFKKIYLAAIDLYYKKFGTYRMIFESDIPDAPIAGILYLVGDNHKAWIAAMRCPCGCGKTLEMNLLPDAKPVWKYSAHTNANPTLHPSIWMHTGCKCHFWLKNGRIIWV